MSFRSINTKTLSIMLILAIAISCTKAEQQTAETVTNAFEHGSWRSGLDIGPHSSINAEEFNRQYEANPVYWDLAFDFIKENDLNALEPGRYVIDEGNVTAFIAYGPAGTIDEIRWESHKNFTDLQYVIDGTVTMGIAPLSNGTVIEEYDPARDIMFYDAEGDFYQAVPGEFFLFFPTDMHRPNLKYDDNQVKRLLIKIRSI